MSESKRPLKVFLCHAHADRDRVRALYTRLTKDGVDAWLDKAKLLPGQDWELEIRKAVREADVVVVCLSKQFNQAGFRQKEVRLALDTAMEKPEGEIFIIPARLEECDTLESLRKWHWVDLFEVDGYEMLMRALRARAKNIGVTLQIRRSWLPKVTTPSVESAKIPSSKKVAESKSTIVNIEEKIDETQPKNEKPKPAKKIAPHKLRVGLIAMIIGLSGIIFTILYNYMGLQALLIPSAPRPTMTFGPSITPAPTRTPSPTPTDIPATPCLSTITDDTNYYEYPAINESRGVVPAGTLIYVVGVFDNGRWYKFQNANKSMQGWAKKETVTIVDNCLPRVYTAGEAFHVIFDSILFQGMPSEVSDIRIINNDYIASTPYPGTTSSENVLSLNASQNNVFAVIDLDKSSRTPAADLTIRTSFKLSVFMLSGTAIFLGFRWGANAISDLYEIRIYPNSTGYDFLLNFVDGSGFYKVDEQRVVCAMEGDFMQQEKYLELIIRQQSLIVNLVGCQDLMFELKKEVENRAITLMPYGVSVDFHYLLITLP